MTELQALVLGIIEGFTEFLPISSTAHLILGSRAQEISTTNFTKSFIIAIQLGAILSIVVLYWKTLLRDWATNTRIIIAFIPTAVIGFGLYKIIRGILFENLMTLALMLIIGGVLLIVFEKFHTPVMEDRPIAEISHKQAFLIGCAQALAVVPGVSRAGATIMGGMLLGVGRKTIVEFSFLLAVPTMAAATGYDLIRNAGDFSTSQFHILALGFAVSFIAAIVGVKFLLGFIKKKSFVPFGMYRIVLGSVVLGWLFMR